ncbi:MAG: hypothetical protein AB1458_12720 [Bacteroidota bacterium]
MIKKILVISVWTLLVSGTGIILGFAGREQSDLPCREMRINIERDGENYFVEEEDIIAMLKERGDSVIGQRLSTLQVDRIEQLVMTNPWVAAADVYMSIDGVLSIDIRQRDAMLRIINAEGESYYMDTRGKLMLWSQNFTPRVLTVNGAIAEKFNNWYTISAEDIIRSDSLSLTVLDELYTLARYITSDYFWNAQIAQIHLLPDGEFTLVPQAGEHKIIFGDISDMEEKFHKLKTFYKEGLNYTGWELYDTINLKFKNQVVCTKIK